MLGMRKATKKASVTGPAPKASATTMSRAKPSTRLASVAEPMAPTAPSTWRSMPPAPCASPAALTLNSLRACGMMQRGSTTHSTSDQEDSPGGEHEVGYQADPPERAAPPPQPHAPHEGPLGREDRARHRGRGA